MQRRVATRGIIINEQGQMLGLKFRTSDGSESEFWGTPGGGLDPGESLHDGLTRESIEETGVTPKIGKLLFIQQFIPSEKKGTSREEEQLEFFFHIENADDYKKVDLESTTHGAIEHTRIEFVDPKTAFIKPLFLSDIDIISAIKNDGPIYIANNL